MTQTARPHSYVLVAIFGGFGPVIAVVSLIYLLHSSGEAWAWCVLLIFGLSLIPAALYSLLVRLEWSSSHIAVTVGRWRREVSLTGLTSVDYESSGRSAKYLLADAAGRRLAIQVTLFLRDDEWKPLILETARLSGAKVEPRAKVSLEHADGTGRGFLA